MSVTLQLRAKLRSRFCNALVVWFVMALCNAPEQSGPYDAIHPDLLTQREEDLVSEDRSTAFNRFFTFDIALTTPSLHYPTMSSSYVRKRVCIVGAGEQCISHPLRSI